MGVDGEAYSRTAGDVAEGAVFPVAVSAAMTVLLLVSVEEEIPGWEVVDLDADARTYFFLSLGEVAANGGAGYAGS